MAQEHHLLVEGCSGRPSRLLSKLGEHERLAQASAAVHMGVDPAPRKAQRNILAALAAAQPGVRPQVDCGIVYGVRHVVSGKIAAL